MNCPSIGHSLCFFHPIHDQTVEGISLEMFKAQRLAVFQQMDGKWTAREWLHFPFYLVKENMMLYSIGAYLRSTLMPDAMQRWEKDRLLSLSSRFYFCPWVRRAWVQVFDFRCESGKFELDLKKTSWVRKVWVWIKKKLSQESLSLDGQILS